MGADIFLRSVLDPRPDSKNWPQGEIDTSTAEDFRVHVENYFEQLRATGGYYRNAYNSGDVMWAMGLSWSDTVSKMLGEDYCLPIERARELIELIEARPITREHVVAHIYADMCKGHPVMGPMMGFFKQHFGNATHEPEPAEPPTLQEIEEMFAFLNERRDGLLVILRKSVALNEPLYCEL
jgi:hypothetical protein